MALLLVVSLSIAEQSFSEQYERGYNIFNPAGQYAPDNPLNPALAFASDNPFNPANQYHPDNPLNPARERKRYRESSLARCRQCLSREAG
jgi:hypothetical protein